MSATMDLLQLPELVKEHLISNYLPNDKLNLACCSEDFCDSLAYCYWREVFIPWHDLSSPEALSSSLVTKLQYVNTLHLVSRSPAVKSSPSTDWEQVERNFQVILDNCNATRLHKITVHGMLVDEGMCMLLEKFKNLREVTFIDCTEITVNGGWSRLVELQCLKKLSLKNCFIRNTGIEMLVGIKNLKEFHLNIDWKDNLYITRNALKHISKMSKLKKLTISCSYDLELSKRDLSCLKILGELEELSFEHTLLDDDALTYICKQAKKLRNLNISGCEEITERGLLELVHLPLLMKVNLRDTNFSSTAILEFSKKTDMQEMSEPHQGIYAKFPTVREYRDHAKLPTERDYCDKLANNFLREVLFIPWHDLSSHKSLSSNLEDKLQHADILHFANGSGHPISLPSKAWEHVVKYYYIVLNSCDEKSLCKLTICDMLTDEGVYMFCEKLLNLREVTLIDCMEISSNGWKQLMKLKELKKLTLKNCRIGPTGLENLAKIENLEELHLNIDCKDNLKFTWDGLKHISSMKKLKKLMISCSNELELSKIALGCLKILPELEELSFEQTLVDDDALIYLCKQARNLKNLNIRDCQLITERGLSELVNLPSLRKVNLQDINASPATFLDLKQKGLHEMSEPHRGIFTTGKLF